MLEFRNRYDKVQSDVFKIYLQKIKDLFKENKEIRRRVIAYVCSIDDSFVGKDFIVSKIENNDKINCYIEIKQEYENGAERGILIPSNHDRTRKLYLNFDKEFVDLLLNEEKTSKQWKRFNQLKEFMKNVLAHELDHAAQSSKNNRKTIVDGIINDEKYVDGLINILNSKNCNDVRQVFINNELETVFYNKISRFAKYYFDKNEIASFITGFKRVNDRNDSKLFIDICEKMENFLIHYDHDKSYEETIVGNEIVLEFFKELILYSINSYLSASLTRYPNIKKNLIKSGDAKISILDAIYEFTGTKFE